MLGEFLEENCPDVSVQVIIKSAEDWGDYIDGVSAIVITIRRNKITNGYNNCVNRCAALTVFTNVLAPSSTLLKVSQSGMVLTLSSTSALTTVARASKW